MQEIGMYFGLAVAGISIISTAYCFIFMNDWT